MAEYADYHHAMAQHAAHALTNSNQLHPAMAQIPMNMLSAGLNLTVSPGPNQVHVMSNQLNNSGHHQLANPAGHHVMYSNVQTHGAGGGGGHHVSHGGGHGSSGHGGGHAGGHGGGGGGHGGQGGGRGGGGSHKKAKKPKVNKDGVPAPKRATTAYINFTQWYREELKKAGRPIPKIGDFGKECAGKWNTMIEDDKKPFLETAARDRERYKREMQVFKPARDANKPKRPGTAFMLFMGDFRKEMAGKEPEGGVAALAKLGGERWRNMSEEDKRPYVEKQNVEKIRYEAAMEDYRKMSAPGGGAAAASGPSPKQARLSTEGSENESDSDSLQQQSANNEISSHQSQQQSNMMAQKSVSTPSPASSSPPSQLTSPSPGASGQQTSHASALMAGYSQHSFPNFGHPAAGAAANYNQTHAHSGNMAPGTSPYLPAGAGGTYSQLPGHYQWN